jgi:hypothetical protein
MKIPPFLLLKIVVDLFSIYGIMILVMLFDNLERLDNFGCLFTDTSEPQASAQKLWQK